MRRILSLHDLGRALLCIAACAASVVVAQPQVEQIISEHQSEERPSFPPEVSDLIDRKLISIQTASPGEAPGHSGDGLTDNAPAFERLEAALSPTRFVAYEFRIDATSPKNQKPWLLRGTIARLRPTTDSKEFREIIQLVAPEAVSKYSWVTFRSEDSAPDLVWIYSPFIKKERRVVPAIRDESLFYTSMSASDVFTFSEQRANFASRIAEEKTYLAPLRILRADNAGGSTSCMALPSDIAGVKWRPRSLTKVELTTRDPYSSIGRLILYVDSETALPLIKLTYDRKGALQKLVFSEFAAIMPNGNDRRMVPIYRGTTALAIESQRLTQLTATNASLCSDLPEGWSLERFDPYRIGKLHEQDTKHPGTAPQTAYSAGVG